MALTLEQIRQSDPIYRDADDDELFNYLHKNYYSDVPREELAKEVGYEPSLYSKLEDFLGFSLTAQHFHFITFIAFALVLAIAINAFFKNWKTQPHDNKLTSNQEKSIPTWKLNIFERQLIVGIIAIFLLILIFPPFNLIAKNGVVINMGYDWIFTPPKRGYITANVNISMLMVEWLGVMVVGALSFILIKNLPIKTDDSVLKRTNIPSTSLNKEPTDNSVIPKKVVPTGMDLWLFLLVSGLIFFGPLFTAAKIYSDTVSSETLYPVLSTLEDWKTYKTVTWWVYWLFTVICIYGGLYLAISNNWKAVKRTIAILWIIGPISYLVSGVLLPIFILNKANDLDAKFVVDFIIRIIIAALWTAYLLKSKRVRNTYLKEDGCT